MTRLDGAALNWPTREQHALLAELVAARPARAALAEWVGRARPPLDDHTAALLPFVYLTLAEARPGAPWLAAHYRRHWLRNQRAIQAGLDTADTLRAAGIPAVLIKGVPLCLFYYGDAGARPMADADLVLRPRDLPRADEVLRARGWRRQSNPPASALPFVRSLEYRHPLDVSLDVQRYPFLARSPVSAVERFWARCVEREVRGVKVLVPDATHMLILACLHGRKPEGSVARWPLDAHAILGKADEPVDWDELVAVVRDAGIVPPVRDALTYLGDLGLPVPAEVHATLARVPPSRADRRQYVLLARGPDRWGLLDVLANRWDEYAAVDGRDRFRRALGFPAYFLDANAFYRGRKLRLTDVWSRMVADWRRLTAAARSR